MTSRKIGVIGGSGLYNLGGVEVLEEIKVETPFGSPSGPVVHGKIDGVDVFFLARHSGGHKITPREINYRANIYALKSLGVSYTLSISAVGSLKEELSPRMVFLPDQFVDWTKGKRERTFFGNGVVGHVSCADPIDKNLFEVVERSCKEAGISFGSKGSYICIEGPQFSSRAESHIYRSFGCSVIGMTNVPEAYLAKEAGMAYATVALVTDYDCWKEEHCTLEEIMAVMGDNYKTANELIRILVPMINKEKPEIIKENEYAVVTQPDLIPEEFQTILEVLKK